MLVNTRLFGEIVIEDDKVLEFEQGILGFEELKKYAIVFNNEQESKKGIMWLQSIEDGSLAFPVIDPTLVEETYNPIVEEDWLEPIGSFETAEDLYVLAILTVPTDITKMTVNLKAPLIINTISRKGCQIIVNNEEYKVKHNVYEYFNSLKEKEESGC